MIDFERRRSTRPTIAARAVPTIAALLALAGCGTDVTPPPPPPPPPVNLDLRVGESAVVSGSQVGDLTIEGGEGAREYRIAVQSASSVAEGNWSIGLQGSPGASPAAASGSARPSTRRLVEKPGTTPADLSMWELHQATELRLRRSARRELGVRRAMPARGLPDPGLQASSRAAAPSAARVPVVGEEREFLFAVQPDVTVSCTDTAAVITAEAKAVGERFVIYRDMQAVPWFKAADYAEMLAALEGVIYPVSSAYFGQPADIDGNERVVVLVTEEANKLSPAQGLTFIAGFFVPTDISDSGSPGGGGSSGTGVCATSNEAEILYLIAPDPLGEFGREHSIEFAKETVIGVTGHELQHLINAERRVILGGGDFGDLEETWLDEGLSHLAEEVNGLAAAGLSLRSNLSFEEAFADIDAFESFHLPNFQRLGQTSGCGGWMNSPDNTQTIPAEDPGGCSGLRYRGFAWLFMRWLGDHEGPGGNGVVPGSLEQNLFRELVVGGPTLLTGIANIERAVDMMGSGRSWSALLGDFLITPAADDQAAGAPARTQILTWDLPDAFLGLHENGSTRQNFSEPYPLEIEVLGFGPLAEQFSLRSSTARYYALESADGAPDYRLEMLDTAGLPLSADVAAQLTVIRVR